MIKSALLEAGMSQADFMSLIQELGKELQSDGLAGILAESAEEIGIDGGDLIQQVKENPLQSAEMIYLASELRKGGGDEKALTDILVNYVERVGSQFSQDLSEKKGEEGEKHIQRALGEVKSNLVQHLGNMDIKDDLLTRLEERVNQRMDDVFDKLRSEWIKSHSAAPEQEFHKELTVLETLERGVSENEDLGEILKIIRTKVEAEEIDENDFDEIYPEMVKQEQLRKSENDRKGLSAGVMRDQMLMTFVDKEIARAKRYGTTLSALGFTLVKAKAKTKSQTGQIGTQDVIDALLHQLAEIFRTPDIVGELRKNHFIVLLPMTHRGQAKVALDRAMKIFNLKPIDVDGFSLEIKVAGVVADIDLKDVANASSLADQLSAQLTDMATRIGNLHANS
jgi:GGDEF domain-containing protein